MAASVNGVPFLGSVKSGSHYLCIRALDFWKLPEKGIWHPTLFLNILQITPNSAFLWVLVMMALDDQNLQKTTELGLLQHL